MTNMGSKPLTYQLRILDRYLYQYRRYDQGRSYPIQTAIH